MSLPPRFRRRFCEALDCNNTSVDHTMFQFPGDQQRCKKWEYNIQMKGTSKKYRYLCSDHFEMWCFTDTFKRRLIKEACPTIQVPSNDLLSEEQSPEELLDNAPTLLPEECVDEIPAADIPEVKDPCPMRRNTEEDDYELMDRELFEPIGVACL